MGCTGSKLEDLEAIALCRDRSQLLEFAIRHRYSFAHAHLAYLHSLASIGVSLNNFFDLENLSSSPLSPHLPLPTQRKADPDPTPPSPLQSHIPTVHHHSRSDSGSHLHFHSDSGSESSISSPLHDHVHGYGPNADETLIPTPPNYYMNYMQSQPSVPSVAYQQRPQSTETIRVEEDSFGYLNPNPNPSSYSYPYAYPSGFGGFFGSSSAEATAPPPAYYYPSSSYPPPPGMTAAVADSSVSRAPPPPPSPPRTSPWDFLNPFEAFERYYPQYTPSRDSKELREEEGIPDLEDEDSPHELVKEVDGEQKFALNSKKVEDEADRGMAGEAKYQVRSSVEGEKGGVEYEVHLVDKNVVGNEEDGRAVWKGRGSRPVADVVREIKAQFDRASESGNEVSKILEVGKLPYRGKSAVYKGGSLDRVALILVTGDS